mmetsp:Transcript_3648/g.9269  ORF Transcript_3648/g.9269 Transcript_3648/m.9269 type:complete len:385 (+) Transcript_3648:96-1250(+)
MREPEEGTRFTLPRALDSSSSSNISVKRASDGPHNSASMPPSVLRRGGKFDSSSGRGQPLDLTIIQDIFGINTTLYHVLRIEPQADAAEIRRAYLRRGRATLLNGGIAFNAHNAPRNLDDVPELARKKFQATSIAYEILSNPELRYDYDRYGVVHAQPTDNAPISREMRRHKRKNSVRWTPYVEEKLISYSPPVVQSRKKESAGTPKKKTREHGWIESRLRHIDKEAEKFLRGDALESFVDESFTSVKDSIGSLIGNTGSSDSKRSTDVAAAVEPGEGDFSVDNLTEPATNFLKVLRTKTSLFLNDPHIKVEPYKPEQPSNEQDEWCVTHSPCSVITFGPYSVEDETASKIHACGLSDSFHGLLGRDDNELAELGSLAPKQIKR